MIENTNILKSKYEWTIFILTNILIASFTIFAGYSWGRYLYLGVTAFAFLIYTVRNNFRMPLHNEAYYMFFSAFTVYALITSIIAMNSSESIANAKTLFEIAVCFYMLWVCYDELNNPQMLIHALKWSGYIISLYTVSFYGWSGLLNASLSQFDRVSSEFANVNVIGMLCAMSTVVQFYQILINRKFNLESLFVVPCMVVILGTQSRKALLCLGIGILGILIEKNLGKKNIIRSFFGLLLSIVVLFIAYKYISNLPEFAGIFQRFERAINSITGNGVVDYSTKLRRELVTAGIRGWIKNPIFGVGIGCSHLLAVQELGVDYYLHNNYVELLSGGGIVGFIIYYSMHIYIIRNLVKYHHRDKVFASFLLIWMSIILIMDFGMVTYYSKTQWFYLMVFFLGVKYLKNLECEDF